MERLMKTIFDWEHFAVYLGGAMDFAPSGGKDWRDEWTKKLISMGISSEHIFNPCDKPLKGVQFNLDDEAALIKQFRDNRDWDGLDDLMSQIMHVDCRLLDHSDLVLVNFPRMPRIPSVDAMLEEEYRNTTPTPGYKDLYERYLSMRVPTYGTIHEIVLAHQTRKPTFIVWEGTGKNDCSAWLMRLVGHKNIFSNVDGLIDHLVAISQGQKSFNANEWLLLDPK